MSPIWTAAHKRVFCKVTGVQKKVLASMEKIRTIFLVTFFTVANAPFFDTRYAVFTTHLLLSQSLGKSAAQIAIVKA